MENLALVFEIVLPAVVMGIMAYLLMNGYLKYEESKHKLDIERSRQEIILPVRMQAYERIILFLERSAPESLIRRVLKTNSSARLFQSDLINAVRSEYDHNMSQQIYLSANSWSMVKTATEETVRLINISASKLSASATATDLAENILQIAAQVNKLPSQVALENIKKEFSQSFLINNAGSK